MHPALRKGPLFTKNTPPIFHFFNKKNTPISTFLPKKPIFHFFYKKHPPPFHFLFTGLKL